MQATRILEVAICVGLAILAGCAGVEVTKVNARGFDDAVKISAGEDTMTVVVVPQWAGRVGQLALPGLDGSALVVNESIDGKVLAEGDSWMHWDGNTTDLVHVDAKGNEVRQLKGLWLHPYPTVEMLPAGVKLTSDINEKTGFQVTKIYELRPGGGMLSYEYIVRNTGAETSKAWQVVERAVVPTTGYVLVPLDKAGPIPGGWATREKGAKIPAGSQAETVGDFLMMQGGGKQGVGLSVRASQGWIASVTGRNVFLMTFPLVEGGEYPLFGGANVVPWIAKDLVELEPCSPAFTLAPKGSEGGNDTFAFRQQWYGLTIPADVEADDPQAVGQWIQTKYDAYADAKELPTCGRIGMQQ